MHQSTLIKLFKKKLVIVSENIQVIDYNNINEYYDIRLKED